jgi:tRNA pseudouridine38-40 synthase
MTRAFIKLAYKGTNFFGWQIQPNQVSVQAEIESALSKINGDKPIKIIGCGRTDSGVHASEYFAHADLPEEMALDLVQFKLNNMLSSDIVILNISKKTKDAHARFDAKKRTYHYFIHNQKDPFIQDISWYRKGELDLKAMNLACAELIKNEDFECFSKVKTEVNNFKCHITSAAWISSDKGYIFTITSNRFLRNMVRAIVGTMIDIGEGKLSIEDFKRILTSQNRSEAGQSVPAQGLFLAKIDY